MYYCWGAGKYQDNQNPDSINEVSYGFPLVFKTSISVGIAGNLKQTKEINTMNLLLDAALYASMIFVLLSAFSLRSKR